MVVFVWDDVFPRKNWLSTFGDLSKPNYFVDFFHQLLCSQLEASFIFKKKKKKEANFD